MAAQQQHRSLGFTEKQVVVTSVDEEQSLALVTDRFGGVLTVRTDVLRSKGPRPKEGEQWVVDRTYGDWTFALCIGAPPAERRTETFSKGGALTVKTGSHRLYNDSGAQRTIHFVRASVGSPPEGDSVLVDVNLDGLTVFEDEGTRPALSEGETTVKATPSVTSWPDGSYLTVDIDQVGSVSPGADLTVQVVYG